jgi:hypothetical protein
MWLSSTNSRKIVEKREERDLDHAGQEHSLAGGLFALRVGRGKFIHQEALLLELD